ncbi:MAG TPA: methyltransferase domain-containing protein [Thermoanaerobaculia bacterium]|nr:methyltransferase domain-containing protein [Thermoanaerobaculia bacterium]
MTAGSDFAPADSRLLNKMTRDRVRWERIAQRHPYYAVIADPRNFGSGNPAALREFFESGEAYVDGVLGRISDMSGGSNVRTVLEFGCGPGRLVCAFARRGFEVTAVDVSPTMLALARQNCEARNVRRIRFQSVEEYLQSGQTFDMVNATLVLQRMPPRHGYRILEQLISRVAPDGYLHIQLPYRSYRDCLSSALMVARRHSEAVNKVVNVLRHRPADADVAGVEVYSLDEIFALLSAGKLDVRKVDLSRENELEVATLVARRRLVKTAETEPVMTPPPSLEPTPPHESDELINVRELIRNLSIDELNRKADQYFAGMTSFESQLAKPFGSFGDAPSMLINIGVLMTGMRLRGGQTVLDFGAGTGWLSHRLAGMGCRMIVTDVSQTALDVARRRFEEIGLAKTQPRFLRYEGERLDLPDESVDRIICFDSFHHVPNAAAVTHEFGRVLKPGGIAGFSEPGPRHSLSPQSQFEMRAYGVIENDVDIDAIWDDARTAGFQDLTIAVFNGDPVHLSLERFHELIRGGDALADAAHAMRHYLENARVFFLKKAGAQPLDSLNAEGLASDVDVVLLEATPIRVRAKVINTGTAEWLPSKISPGGVWLGCHLYSGGQLLNLDYYRQELATAQNIAPGEIITVTFELPPLSAGEYDLEFDCVSDGITWFAQRGSRTTRLHLRLA